MGSKRVGVLIILMSECFNVYFNAKSWVFLNIKQLCMFRPVCIFMTYYEETYTLPLFLPLPLPIPLPLLLILPAETVIFI